MLQRPFWQRVGPRRAGPLWQLTCRPFAISWSSSPFYAEAEGGSVTRTAREEKRFFFGLRYLSLKIAEDNRLKALLCDWSVTSGRTSLQGSFNGKYMEGVHWSQAGPRRRLGRITGIHSLSHQSSKHLALPDLDLDLDLALLLTLTSTLYFVFPRSLTPFDFARALVDPLTASFQSLMRTRARLASYIIPQPSLPLLFRHCAKNPKT